MRAAWILMVFSWAVLAQAAESFGNIVPLLDKHCLECHSSPNGKGGIHLDVFKSTPDVLGDTARWEGVLTAVRAYHMPPPKDSQMSPEERDRLVTWIDQTLEEAYQNLPPDPGPPVLRRLTRDEFDRTLRDLLGIKRSFAEHFPPDGGGGEGFQNNADTLFFPPLLLEKVLDAVGQAVDEAPFEVFAVVKPESDSARHQKDAFKATIENFGLRAFRQPMISMDPQRWLRVYEHCKKLGMDDEKSWRQTFRAMLASPKFLYRIEQDKRSTKAWAISSYEMATRLSYFLWGTMPDAELFRLAGEDKLQDDSVITAQVARMLADPKARVLSETFATQWLVLGPLREGAGPDPARYQEYTPELRESMLGEPVAFFHGLITENRSICDLLDSDYTWVDERLGRHYGIGGGKGDGFTKVKLSDRRRGGVTGMAAVHAVTSYPGRTSLVLRGAWVIDRLLDSPPPPPPPNVAQLPKEDSPKENLSLRERLALHRDQPACASCHDRIDPVGHPLEHFDPLGRWIDRDLRGKAIDASGTLPDGTEVTSPESLRKALVAHKQRFREAFARKLLGYALGRGILPADRPTLKHLDQVLIQNEERIVPLITAICTSYPFRHRVTPR